MKKKFRLEDYQDSKTCMSFDNEEEYAAFSKYLDENNRFWNSGSRYTKFGSFKDFDCMVIYFNNGTRSAEYLAKGSKDTILKYSDFDWESKINWNDYIGKEVYVSNFDKEFQCKNVSIFEEYRQDLSYPFVVRTRYKEGFALESYKYIKLTTEKEYKPYDEPNFEWVKDGKKVIHIDKEHRISSVGVRENGVWFVGLSFKKAYTTYLNMQEFLDECIWLDGSPCGELV